ncbi:MAG: SDR family NAD(P)-dependent oxidoreductase [Archangiaceae bacterium]|nr:SDR family NAD(P)-dependent oxidoreductase [Archangiaceae bacterium]
MDYRNALVTGASSGIGRGLAAWLAKRGVKVWAAARRLENLEQLKAEASDLIVPMKLDCAKGEATEAAVRALDAECGGLDLVVANAGVAVENKPKRLDWKAIENMLQVNVIGATATLCGALPGMLQRNRGHLVGISSIAAFGGLPRLGGYAGTKAYLMTFLQGLRLDLKGTGVIVSSIHPGYVKSEMTSTHKKAPPFLMETDDAVETIGAAIYRGAESVVFPWQMSLGMRTLASLPRPLYEAAARKLR